MPKTPKKSPKKNTETLEEFMTNPVNRVIPPHPMGDGFIPNEVLFEGGFADRETGQLDLSKLADAIRKIQDKSS